MKRKLGTLLYLVHERDNADNQLTAQKPTGGNQGHPARAIDPASDPGQDRHPVVPRNYLTLSDGSAACRRLARILTDC
jgi:hypothetical protein